MPTAKYLTRSLRNVVRLLSVEREYRYQTYVRAAALIEKIEALAAQPLGVPLSADVQALIDEWKTTDRRLYEAWLSRDESIKAEQRARRKKRAEHV